MTFKNEISKYKNNVCLFNKVEINTIPEKPGIYLIGLAKGIKDITILNDTTAIKFYGNKDMVYHDVDKYYDKWLQGNRDILAIGETDNLRERIHFLVQYSNGNDVPHRGERVLWQVENWRNNIFNLYWTPTHEVNLKLKLNLLHREEYGCLPLANIKAK